MNEKDVYSCLESVTILPQIAKHIYDYGDKEIPDNFTDSNSCMTKAFGYLCMNQWLVLEPYAKLRRTSTVNCKGINQY